MAPILFFVLGYSCALIAQPVQENILGLRPGETTISRIKQNDFQSYAIKINAGETVVLTVPEYSVSMGVKAFTPDGEQIGQIDQQQTESLIKPTFIVAERAGEYRIDVYASWDGEFLITASLPHATTEIDKKHLAAQKLYIDSLIIIPSTRNITAQEKTKRRLEKLEERLAIYRAIGEPELIGLSLKEYSSVLGDSGDHSKMLAYYSEALEIFRAAGKTAEQCGLLLAIANDAAFRLADYQKASEYLDKALTLSQSKAFKYGE